MSAVTPPWPAAMVHHARDLSNPLVRKVVLHVYNAYRADKLNSKGVPMASKQKYKGPEAALLDGYQIALQPGWLKNHVVRNVEHRQ